MGIAFKLKIKHQGSSQINTYVGKDGNAVFEKIKGALEDSVILVKGRTLFEASVRQRERTLFMAAVFMHRVVNRTPVDENYYYQSASGDMGYHEKDNDAVRDSWIASYNNRKVSAAQLKASGITFDKFNDEGEIKAIYEIFRKAFIQKKNRAIKAINIENLHERFSMLEYGEYLNGRGVIGEAEYKHGVENGFSVQAPYGMLRITEAEFQKMSLNMSTPKLIETYVKKSQRLTKIPSQEKIKKLKKLIGDVNHISSDKLSAVEDLYQ